MSCITHSHVHVHPSGLYTGGGGTSSPPPTLNIHVCEMCEKRTVKERYHVAELEGVLDPPTPTPLGYLVKPHPLSHSIVPIYGDLVPR